jgi:hypothetical protein
MRDLSPDEVGIINVQGKVLPFRGAGKYDIVNTDNSADIVEQIKKFAQKYKILVVDDFQYVMANEFMRRAAEKGYDKFTEIARHAWDIADCVRTLPNDVIVYVMCHIDTDQDGSEKLKTIGKLLDEKIVLEGMSTIVLKTAVSDGQYMFLTQNNGKDTTKSPDGMFPSYAIDNNLKYVDDKIRSYYELGDHLTDEEMAEKDEAVRHDEVEKEPRRRPRRSERTEVAEAPRRNLTAEAGEAIANANTRDDGEPVVFSSETVEEPEMPRRRRREVSVAPAAPVEAPAEAPTEEPRRRRRRIDG